MGFNLAAQNSSGLNISTGTGLITGGTPAGTVSIGGKIGQTSVDLSLQALETKGLIRTLARPNLTAMSGEEASFLAGGEFPYPVPTGLGQVTIEFRQYGVKLKVTPTIEPSGEIRLKVAPEVSQLDPAHSIQIDGFLLPSLDISNASTTVELKDGQSFAIAGLFQQGYNNAVNQVPGLANLPVLGTLFRSASWQKQETELAIIVTPHLATPTDDIDSLPNPLRTAVEPSAIDLILAGMTEKPGPAATHAATP
jgi:pilus assembly protein CpaC